jgi:uncharacterized protein (DUF362 family)
MAEMTRVALVHSDNRRGAIAQALHLIRDDLKAAVGPDVLLKPNLVSHRRQVASTHADALSATLDALFAAGARQITIAEGATNATAGFDAFGHRREVAGRPVRFFDLNREETAWDPLILSAIDGTPLEARVSRTVAASACRVSLALMKTHVISTATMSLKNMLSSVHPADRVRMHGYPGGNGSTGWKRPVVEFLKGDNVLVNVLTRTQGRVRNLLNEITSKSRDDDGSRLSNADLAFLRSVTALNRNLVTLTRLVGPHVSVLDGFIAMHREGPRHGTPIHLGLALAGTDPVAVDAVAAAAMGFDPMQIGHLRLAHEAGLGTADLAHIEVMGDSLASVSRRCTPHSNFAVHRHWDRFAIPARSAIRGPHSTLAKGREATPR